MAEMEAAWFDLAAVSEFAKKELKYCIKQTAERCREEFAMVGQDADALIKMGAKADAVATLQEAVDGLGEATPEDLAQSIRKKLKELQS